MNARHAAPDPERPPARPEMTAALQRRRYSRRWMAVVAAVDVGVGAAYLSGPTSTPNLQLIGQAVPIPACAAVFALVGAALAAGLRWGRPWYVTGGFSGAVLWLIWGGAATITLAAGSANSASGLPLFGGLAVLHLLITYGAHTRLIGGGQSR